METRLALRNFRGGSGWRCHPGFVNSLTSFKPFSWEQFVIEFHTYLFHQFEDLEPMLHSSGSTKNHVPTDIELLKIICIYLRRSMHGYGTVWPYYC